MLSTHTLGSSTDTWGRTWSDTELADGTFRSRFDKETSDGTLQIDQIRIKVYHSTDSATSTYYIHSDHLGGQGVTTDSNGDVVELTEYYPYGEQRVTSGDFEGQRKYTGHEYDTEADLTFAGARYYDQDTGRWLSQDPANITNPEQFLRDPQQFNYYSYARNNPFAFVDSTGEKVELVGRSLNIPVVGSLGAHAFVLITPHNPDVLPRINGVDNYSRVTLGGYTSNFITGELFKDANRDSDFAISREDYKGAQTIHSPSGMTQKEFEATIVNNFNNSPDIIGSYSPLGNPRFSGQHNSNNFATSLLTKSGIGVNSISNLNDNAYTAGLGRSIDPNATSILNRTLNRLSNSLKDLERAVTNLKNKKEN